MIGDKMKTNILATRLIADLEKPLACKLGVSADYSCVAMLTTTCDDVTYIALDDATKYADVEVSFAKSFYGGSSNANTPLAGEILGILGGSDPEMVKDAMEHCMRAIKEDVHFYSANEEDSIVYLAHCVSASGSYLSKLAGISKGESLAYLIAPPLEAMYGVNLAMKAADVQLCVLFDPPTETNFAGALLTGSLSACRSACEAFADAVIEVAQQPLRL